MAETIPELWDGHHGICGHLDHAWQDSCKGTLATHFVCATCERQMQSANYTVVISKEVSSGSSVAGGGTQRPGDAMASPHHPVTHHRAGLKPM